MSEDKSKLQLIGEIAQANNKNLELIEELNDRENEIERLKEDNEYLNKVNIELSTEKNRLNNIINELEKYIISQMQEQETLKETKAPTYIFCKLQELKGSNKE